MSAPPEAEALAKAKPIYIVWSKLGKTPPKIVMMGQATAWRAAKAMAHRHPGQRFFVMRADASFKIEDGEASHRTYPAAAIRALEEGK
jgi:hypothetical protein